MGADCSIAEKANKGGGGLDVEKVSILQQCQPRTFGCCGEPITPTGKPLVSALKSRNSSRKSKPGSKDSGNGNLSRESSCSTRASSGFSSQRFSASFRPMRIDEERVRRHFKKVRRVALEAVGELNHFQVFVKRSFETKGEAFDWISGSDDATEVDFDQFTSQLERRGFTGKSHVVFYALCEDPKKIQNGMEGLIIRREQFWQRLAGLGPPFRMVVRQIIAGKLCGIEFNAITEADFNNSQCVEGDQAEVNNAKKKSAGLRRSASLDVIDERPCLLLALEGSSEYGGSPDSPPLPKKIRNGAQPKKRRSL